jgi:hypothetical protein
MAKLSDFGGGSQKLKPEDEVKINLSRWFSNHGADVYWEKRPSYGHQVFRCQTAEKPDLLVCGQRQNYAIEVKQPDGAGDVYTGAEQTYRYWRRFCIEDCEEYYKAGGDNIQPDAILLATGFAPDGRLAQRYDTHSHVRPLPIYDDRRLDYFDPPIHFLPDWEFGIAEAVTRMMWRLATARDDERDDPINVGIGTMLSTWLDGNQPRVPSENDPGPFQQSEMPEPRALYKSFNNDNAGGAACQNWRGL